MFHHFIWFACQSGHKCHSFLSIIIGCFLVFHPQIIYNIYSIPYFSKISKPILHVIKYKGNIHRYACSCNNILKVIPTMKGENTNIYMAICNKALSIFLFMILFFLFQQFLQLPYLAIGFLQTGFLAFLKSPYLGIQVFQFC